MLPGIGEPSPHPVPADGWGVRSRLFSLWSAPPCHLPPPVPLQSHPISLWVRGYQKECSQTRRGGEEMGHWGPWFSGEKECKCNETTPLDQVLPGLGRARRA